MYAGTAVAAGTTRDQGRALVSALAADGASMDRIHHFRSDLYYAVSESELESDSPCAPAGTAHPDMARRVIAGYEKEFHSADVLNQDAGANKFDLPAADHHVDRAELKGTTHWA